MDVRLTAEQQQLRDAAAKLADDLGRHVGADVSAATVAVDDRVIDARGARRALSLSDGTVLAVDVQVSPHSVDLTRADATIAGSPVKPREILPTSAKSRS